jgi:uncharacterized membrane protein YccC
VIAFAASYLIFPSWEFEQIHDNLAAVVYANLNYLVKTAASIAGIEVGTIEYKLARKEVFVKSANLSAAFERMTSEPKRRQKKVKDVHKFVVLNHILSSYIATIATAVSGKKNHDNRADDLKLIKKSIAVLNDCSEKLGGKAIDFKTGKPAPANLPASTRQDDILLKEQLGFINKISVDIAKVTEDILS